MPTEVPWLFKSVLEDPMVTATMTSAAVPVLRNVKSLASDEVMQSDPPVVCAFTLGDPQLGFADWREFRKLNPTALVLDVGQLSPSGLHESWLRAMSDDEASFSRWQRLVRDLRSVMLGGAVAVNPAGTASAEMKGHRFTPAVQLAHRNGLRILPAAGNSIIQLPRLSG